MDVSAFLGGCLQNSKIIFWGRRACLTGVRARAYACMRILIILCIIVLYVRVWLQYVAMAGGTMCQPTALATRHGADRTSPPTSLDRLGGPSFCRRRFNGFTGALEKKHFYTGDVLYIVRRHGRGDVPTHGSLLRREA